MMKSQVNPYAKVLDRNLPRVLSMISNDSLDETIGVADRRYWAWKTVDFPNASLQSLASGIAYLVYRKDLDLVFNSQNFVQISCNLISAISTMTDKKGALSEAFPGEKSFCVTGQVLADCLEAISLLRKYLSYEEVQNLMKILEPLAKFVLSSNETHGIISNHQATNALAMLRWWSATGSDKAMNKAEEMLSFIQLHSNSEGWYMEYTGADPGYQTWTISSLSQIYKECPGILPISFIDKGMKFLMSFALANGSFANGTGSRLTSFIMALGPEMMAKESIHANFLANFVRNNIAKRSFVSLDSIDEPNLAPFFNDIAKSARCFDEMPLLNENTTQNSSANYPSCGLYVRHNKNRSIIVSANRGGLVCFAECDKNSRIVGETVYQNSKGELFVPGRAVSVQLGEDNIRIYNELRQYQIHFQSPLKFIVLRLYVTLFGRFNIPLRIMKNMLSRLLITRQGKKIGEAWREIDFNSMTIIEGVESREKLSIVDRKGTPYHMASARYWSL